MGVGFEIGLWVGLAIWEGCCIGVEVGSRDADGDGLGFVAGEVWFEVGA